MALTLTFAPDGATNRANIGVDGTWRPQDYNLIAWSYDPYISASATAPATGGTVQAVRLKLAVAESITSVCLIVGNAGTSMTSSQNFAGIYQGGTLLGTTADQSVAWASTGFKAMALTGGPFSVAAGDLIVAFYANSTGSLPQFARSVNNSGYIVNLDLATASSRSALADTGQTTALPGTLGALTVAGSLNGWWVGVR